jgi:hypothetical protein
MAAPGRDDLVYEGFACPRCEAVSVDVCRCDGRAQYWEIVYAFAAGKHAADRPPQRLPRLRAEAGVKRAAGEVLSPHLPCGGFHRLVLAVVVMIILIIIMIVIITIITIIITTLF